MGDGADDRGRLRLFAHLETVYLGALARRSLVMGNVRAVVEAAGGKEIMFFPARHDHWLVQTGDGWAAHVAGAIGVSTDAQATWWGGRGVGTVPHGLIAAYGGDTVAAARSSPRRYGRRHEGDSLVDFENDSVRTALGVADALGRELLGVRLDTSETLVDRSLCEQMGDFKPTGVNPELVRPSAARSTPPATGRADRGLGRLHADKIQDFERQGAGRRVRRRLLAAARQE